MSSSPTTTQSEMRRENDILISDNAQPRTSANSDAMNDDNGKDKIRELDTLRRKIKQLQHQLNEIKNENERYLERINSQSNEITQLQTELKVSQCMVRYALYTYTSPSYGPSPLLTN